MDLRYCKRRKKAEIMPAFLTDTKDQLNMLIAGINKGSRDKITSCAHAINGAAASLGAKKLSKAAGCAKKNVEWKFIGCPNALGERKKRTRRT